MIVADTLVMSVDHNKSILQTLWGRLSLFLVCIVLSRHNFGVA